MDDTPATAITSNRGDRRRARFGSRADVAEYLGVPAPTLVRWAYKKIGPPYKIIGRHARYDWRQVDAWIDLQRGGGAAVRDQRENLAAQTGGAG